VSALGAGSHALFRHRSGWEAHPGPEYADTKILMVSVEAVVYTDSHMIAGTVLVQERFQEVLKDPLTDYLDLTNATLSPLITPERVELMPKITVPKSRIAIATLDRPKHENAQARINKSAIKSGTKVCAIVKGIEVYGTAHLASVSDLASRILTHQVASYFPITDCSIVMTQRPFGNTFSAQLALVNREAVDVFSLL